jgi:hypothetical protein
MELEPVSSGFCGSMVVTVKSLHHPSLRFETVSISTRSVSVVPLYIEGEELVYLLGFSKGASHLRLLLPSSAAAFSVKVKGPGPVTVSANPPNNSTAGAVYFPVCVSLFLVSLNLSCPDLHGNSKTQVI